MAKAKTSTAGKVKQEKSLRDALKFAKARGLFKGDLRKPLSPYRAKVARKYLDASKSPSDYVSLKVGRGAKNAGGQRVVATGNGRVLVSKEYVRETVTYSKKKKQIVSTRTGRDGKKTRTVLTMINEKRGTYAVPLYRGAQNTDLIQFTTSADAIAFIVEYANRAKNQGQSGINETIAEWIDEIEFTPEDEEEDF